MSKKTKTLQPYPFDHSYEKTANGVIGTLNSTAQKGLNHPALKEGTTPVYVSLPARLKVLADDLTAAVDQGNSALIDSLMNEGIQALRFNSQHINMYSIHLNDSSLLDSGYPMKQRPAAKGKVSLLDIVPDLTVKYLMAGRDIVTSAAVLLVKRPSNNAVVEVMVTETPNDEASWARMGEGIYNVSRIEFRGLESMKKLYFRVRYHEKGATGHWSLPACIIIH